MNNQHCIVVVQASWVFIGNVTDVKESGTVKIENASVIRIWGTSKGLGEIALNGPTASTVLDPCGLVELPKTSEIFRIACKFT